MVRGGAVAALAATRRLAPLRREGSQLALDARHGRRRADRARLRERAFQQRLRLVERVARRGQQAEHAIDGAEPGQPHLAERHVLTGDRAEGAPRTAPRARDHPAPPPPRRRTAASSCPRGAADGRSGSRAHSARASSRSPPRAQATADITGRQMVAPGNPPTSCVSRSPAARSSSISPRSSASPNPCIACTTGKLGSSVTVPERGRLRAQSLRVVEPAGHDREHRLREQRAPKVARVAHLVRQRHPARRARRPRPRRRRARCDR